MNNGLERVWKEVIVVYFKALLAKMPVDQVLKYTVSK
jgi:hypothetical protein